MVIFSAINVKNISHFLCNYEVYYIVFPYNTAPLYLIKIVELINCNYPRNTIFILDKNIPEYYMQNMFLKLNTVHAVFTLKESYIKYFKPLFS